MKIGDVVVLKSGGPKMTVTSIKDGSLIGCHWFCNKADLIENWFQPEVLFSEEEWDSIKKIRKLEKFKENVIKSDPINYYNWSNKKSENKTNT